MQQISPIFSLGLLITGLIPQVSLAQSAPNQSANKCDLSGAIAAITSRPEHQKSHWGIAVQDIATDQIIYKENADKFFIPASNQKLLTTAAALDFLGKDYQFQTEFYIVGEAPHIKKLILKGGGDPSLTSKQLENALLQLKKVGITQIDEVIIDDSFFTELATHPTWEWSDLAFFYAVPTNSFILDENVVEMLLLPTETGEKTAVQWSDNIAASQWDLDNQLMTGSFDGDYTGKLSQKYGTNEISVTGQVASNAAFDTWLLSIPDPAQYVLDKTIFTLAQNQINIGRTSILKQTSANLDNAVLLTNITSEPLSEIIRTTNQNSDNLFAETLRQTLNSYQQNIPQNLTQLGIDSNSFRFKDGSGLSRHNLTTPFSFVQLLDSMATHPDAAVYQDSLAIAATSGTLTRRFQDTPIAGNFFGKTGTMTNVGTLSGYLDIDGDRRVALSILVNQSEQPGSVTRRGIDDVVGAIHEWGQCSGDRP